MFHPFNHRQHSPAPFPADTRLLTADVVVIQRDHVLLVRRRHAPFAWMWALPGGKQHDPQEAFEQTAIRELREETGLHASPSELQPISIFSEPGRDPRGPSTSYAFLLRPVSDRYHLRAGSDAQAVGWFPFIRVPSLAFDHDDILHAAFTRLFTRPVLSGPLVHAAFRSVKALSDQLGPWENLPEPVRDYYQDVAHFLAEALRVCQRCGEWQRSPEYLERVEGQVLCQACRLPSPPSSPFGQAGHEETGGAQ